MYVVQCIYRFLRIGPDQILVSSIMQLNIRRNIQKGNIVFAVVSIVLPAYDVKMEISGVHGA